MSSLRSFARRLTFGLSTSVVLSSAAMWAALVSPISVQGQTMLTTDQIKQGYIEHAAIAQLHRWFQIYENNDVPIEVHWTY
jgi:hypothetical protein